MLNYIYLAYIWHVMSAIYHSSFGKVILTALHARDEHTKAWIEYILADLLEASTAVWSALARDVTIEHVFTVLDDNAR